MLVKKLSKFRAGWMAWNIQDSPRGKRVNSLCPKSCTCMCVVLLTHSAPEVPERIKNAFWYNNSWLVFQKIQKICTRRKTKIFCKKKMSPHLSQLNVVMAHRNYFRRNNLRILKLATYRKIEDHYSGCKLATFQIGKDGQMFIFCLHKALRFYWFVMVLPIWW